MWSKLITAVRGSKNDMGEAIIDPQAIRILDQEIRNADADLKKFREALADIMVQEKVALENIKKLATKISEYDNYGVKALQANDENLALEVAEKIAVLEAEHNAERKTAADYAKSIASLRKAVAQTEGNIKRLKQQVDIVKATESVHKAQATVARRYGGSRAKLQTALDSLKRIELRQTQTVAKIEAQEEMSQGYTEDHLEKKLEAAGIIKTNASVEAVMARLREKMEQQSF